MSTVVSAHASCNCFEQPPQNSDTNNWLSKIVITMISCKFSLHPHTDPYTLFRSNHNLNILYTTAGTTGCLEQRALRAARRRRHLRASTQRTPRSWRPRSAAPELAWQGPHDRRVGVLHLSGRGTVRGVPAVRARVLLRGVRDRHCLSDVPRADHHVCSLIFHSDVGGLTNKWLMFRYIFRAAVRHGVQIALPRRLSTGNLCSRLCCSLFTYKTICKCYNHLIYSDKNGIYSFS